MDAARRFPDEPDDAPVPSAPDALAARREHSLLALAELGRALDLQLDEHEMAQLALYNLVGHFGIPRAAFWLRPEGGGPCTVAAVVGVPAEARQALAGALDALPTAWPAGEIVRLAAAPWLGEFATLAEAHGLSVLGRLEGPSADVLGYVALADTNAHGPLDAFERDLVAASLGIVSAAIENQRLLHRLHAGNAQLAAANERMKELDQLRSEMLANLNHEFRTPIAVILGAAGCLRDLETWDERGDEFLGMIEKQAARVRDMVTMLLSHAELMSPRASLACEPTDVSENVRDMLATRARALAAAKREVQLVIEDAAPAAMVEPRQLRRAFDELLTNALKFSAPGTAVVIRIGRRVAGERQFVTVDVIDRGRGMTAREIEVAFQPFRQGDGSSTRAVGGLGIGLTACHRIFELMNATIAIASEPGQGTTVHVELPAA